MDLGLTDRVYVLTGASRGLGFATAQSLVADGARVVISSRDETKVTDAVETLGGPDRAVGITADLSETGTAQRLVETARERFGRLDGALISVGGPPPGTAAQATDEQWRTAFETIFLGMARASRTVAAALTDGGAIGLVLSTSVRSPIAGLGISNGLRPGLAGMAKDMADEYGPRGVRVVSLLPGRIMTDRNRELFGAAADPEQARAQAEAAIPLRRIGDPAEFGRVAAFVLSPAASYLTGIALPVDGGALRAICRAVRVRPTRAELAAAAGTTIADVIGPDLRVLFCGINPSLYSAATGHHFGRPGNRFWPTLHRSGFTAGQLTPARQDELLTEGLGITNLVARATARADELSPAELIAGAGRLTEQVRQHRPRWVAVVGVTAYRIGFGLPKATLGRQTETLAGAALWVLPNPSGLNARFTLDRLAAEFAPLRAAVSD
jgi:3-oxoacyl-[acyl-carrier protein] reductase